MGLVLLTATPAYVHEVPLGCWVRLCVSISGVDKLLCTQAYSMKMGRGRIPIWGWSGCSRSCDDVSLRCIAAICSECTVAGGFHSAVTQGAAVSLCYSSGIHGVQTVYRGRAGCGYTQGGCDILGRAGVVFAFSSRCSGFLRVCIYVCFPGSVCLVVAPLYDTVPLHTLALLCSCLSC